MLSEMENKMRDIARIAVAAEQAMTPEALDQWRWGQVIRETDSMIGTMSDR